MVTTDPVAMSVVRKGKTLSEQNGGVQNGLLNLCACALLALLLASAGTEMSASHRQLFSQGDTNRAGRETAYDLTSPVILGGGKGMATFKTTQVGTLGLLESKQEHLKWEATTNLFHFPKVDQPSQPWRADGGQDAKALWLFMVLAFVCTRKIGVTAGRAEALVLMCAIGSLLADSGRVDSGANWSGVGELTKAELGGDQSLSAIGYVNGQAVFFHTQNIRIRGTANDDSIVVKLLKDDPYTVLLHSGGGWDKVEVAGTSASTVLSGSSRLIVPSGRVVIGSSSGETVVRSGAVVSASSVTKEGQAGVIRVTGTHVESAGVVTSDGLSGRIQFDCTASPVCSTVVAGIVSAASSGSTSGLGEVHLMGRDIRLAADASLKSNGHQHGGRVLIGQPGRHGAVRTFVGLSASIIADAGFTGDGGFTRVLSKGNTTFKGRFSSTGGSAAGQGGFTEVSGDRRLGFQGISNMEAPGNGGAGTLLLDPDNIDVVASDPTNSAHDITPPASGTVAASDVGGDMKILASALKDALNGGDVSLSATTAVSVSAFDNPDSGTNTLTLEAVGASLTLTPAMVLTGPLHATAAEDINILDDLTTAGTSALTADSDGSGSGTMSIGEGKKIVTGNGDLTIKAASIDNGGGTGTPAELDAGTGTITILTSTAVDIGLATDGVSPAFFLTKQFLQKITTNNKLILGDSNSNDIQVATIAQAESTNVETVQLVATKAGQKVDFQAAATFNKLVVEAQSINIDDAPLFAAGKMSLTSTSGIALTVPSDPTKAALTAGTGITLDSDLTVGSAGDLVIDAHADPTASDGLTISSTHSITHNNANATTTIKSSVLQFTGFGGISTSGSLTFIPGEDKTAGHDGTLSLNDPTADPTNVNLTIDSLSKITAKTLTMGDGGASGRCGSITVGDITAAQSQNIDTVILDNSGQAASDITFNGSSSGSNFQALDSKSGGDTTVKKSVKTHGPRTLDPTFNDAGFLKLGVDAADPTKKIIIENGAQLEATGLLTLGPASDIEANPSDDRDPMLKGAGGIALCANLKGTAAGNLNIDAGGSGATEADPTNHPTLALDSGMLIEHANDVADQVHITAGKIDGLNIKMLTGDDGKDTQVSIQAVDRTMGVAGGQIDSAALQLELSAAQLEKITTGGTLTLGGATTGSISVGAVTADNSANAATVILKAMKADSDLVFAGASTFLNLEAAAARNINIDEAVTGFLPDLADPTISAATQGQLSFGAGATLAISMGKRLNAGDVLTLEAGTSIDMEIGAGADPFVVGRRGVIINKNLAAVDGSGADGTSRLTIVADDTMVGKLQLNGAIVSYSRGVGIIAGGTDGGLEVDATSGISTNLRDPAEPTKGYNNASVTINAGVPLADPADPTAPTAGGIGLGADPSDPAIGLRISGETLQRITAGDSLILGGNAGCGLITVKGQVQLANSMNVQTVRLEALGGVVAFLDDPDGSTFQTLYATGKVGVDIAGKVFANGESCCTAISQPHECDAPSDPTNALSEQTVEIHPQDPTKCCPRLGCGHITIQAADSRTSPTGGELTLAATGKLSTLDAACPDWGTTYACPAAGVSDYNSDYIEIMVNTIDPTVADVAGIEALRGTVIIHGGMDRSVGAGAPAAPADVSIPAGIIEKISAGTLQIGIDETGHPLVNTPDQVKSGDIFAGVFTLDETKSIDVVHLVATADGKTVTVGDPTDASAVSTYHSLVVDAHTGIQLLGSTHATNTISLDAGATGGIDVMVDPTTAYNLGAEAGISLHSNLKAMGTDNLRILAGGYPDKTKGCLTLGPGITIEHPEVAGKIVIQARTLSPGDDNVVIKTKSGEDGKDSLIAFISGGGDGEDSKPIGLLADGFNNDPTHAEAGLNISEALLTKMTTGGMLVLGGTGEDPTVTLGGAISPLTSGSITVGAIPKTATENVQTVALRAYEVDGQVSFNGASTFGALSVEAHHSIIVGETITTTSDGGDPPQLTGNFILSQDKNSVAYSAGLDDSAGIVVQAAGRLVAGTNVGPGRLELTATQGITVNPAVNAMVSPNAPCPPNDREIPHPNPGGDNPAPCPYVPAAAPAPVLQAKTGIIINNNLKAASCGTIGINSSADPAEQDTSFELKGVLTLADGIVIDNSSETDSNQNPDVPGVYTGASLCNDIIIMADEISGDVQVVGGHGYIQIASDMPSHVIGLGANQQLEISADFLQKITTTNTLQLGGITSGHIEVGEITSDNSNSVRTVRLYTKLEDKTVTFSAASSFQSLTVESNGQIFVNSHLDAVGAVKVPPPADPTTTPPNGAGELNLITTGAGAIMVAESQNLRAYDRIVLMAEDEVSSVGIEAGGENLIGASNGIVIASNLKTTGAKGLSLLADYEEGDYGFAGHYGELTLGADCDLIDAREMTTPDEKLTILAARIVDISDNCHIKLNADDGGSANPIDLLVSPGRTIHLGSGGDEPTAMTISGDQLQRMTASNLSIGAAADPTKAGGSVVVGGVSATNSGSVRTVFIAAKETDTDTVVFSQPSTFKRLIVEAKGSIEVNDFVDVSDSDPTKALLQFRAGDAGNAASPINIASKKSLRVGGTMVLEATGGIVVNPNQLVCTADPTKLAEFCDDPTDPDDPDDNDAYGVVDPTSGPTTTLRATHGIMLSSNLKAADSVSGGHLIIDADADGEIADCNTDTDYPVPGMGCGRLILLGDVTIDNTAGDDDNITITADGQLDLSTGMIKAGTSVVTIHPFGSTAPPTTPRTMGVGSADPTDFAFTAADLAKISSGTLVLGSNTTGSIETGAISKNDSINVNTVKLWALGAASVAMLKGDGVFHTLEVKAEAGVLIDSNITVEPGDDLASAGGVMIDADTDGDGGRLTLSGSKTLKTDVNTGVKQDITILAHEYQQDGKIEAGSGTIKLVAVNGRTMGLGDTTANQFEVGAAELQMITTAGVLIVGDNSTGSVKVKGVTAENSDNVKTVNLVATKASAEITFEATSSSTFNTLVAEAHTAVVVDQSVTTDEGTLVLECGIDPDISAGTITVANKMKLEALGTTLLLKAHGGIFVNPDDSTQLDPTDALPTTTLSAHKGITINSNLKASKAGHLMIDANVNESESGSLTLAANVVIDNESGDEDNITIIADDYRTEEGSLGSGIAQIKTNSASSGDPEVINSEIVIQTTQQKPLALGTAPPNFGYCHVSALELERITAGNGILRLGGENTGNVMVNNISKDNSANVATVKLQTHIARKNWFDGADSTFQELVVEAGKGVEVKVNLYTDGGHMSINADIDDDGDGPLTVAAGKMVRSTDGAKTNMKLEASSYHVAGSLHGGSADCTPSSDPDPQSCGWISIEATNHRTMAMGSDADAKQFHVSDEALQRITTNGYLAFGGAEAGLISVTGITKANSSNVKATRILATHTDGINKRTVTFNTNASTFQDLEVHAARGVDVAASLYTDVGYMTINADSDDDGTDGRFTIAASKHVSTAAGNNYINIHAAEFLMLGLLGTDPEEDVDQDQGVDAGSATITIEATNERTMGLGEQDLDFDVTGDMLQRITTKGILKYGGGEHGGMSVKAVTRLNSENVATVKLLANGDTRTIAVHGSGGSNFRELVVEANDGITINAHVTAWEGLIDMDGDTDVGPGPGGSAITVNEVDAHPACDPGVVGACPGQAGPGYAVKLEAATHMTLKAATGGIMSKPSADCDDDRDAGDCDTATVNFQASTGIRLNSNLKTSQTGHLRIYPNIDNNSSGDLTLAQAVVIDTASGDNDSITIQAAGIIQAADDPDDPLVNGDNVITSDSPGSITKLVANGYRTIGLGTSSGDLQVRGEFLQRITSQGILQLGGELGSGIKVDGITAAHSENVKTVKLSAVRDTKTVEFEGSAVTFETLVVEAAEGIKIETSIYTEGTSATSGSITMDADSDNDGHGMFDQVSGSRVDAGLGAGGDLDDISIKGAELKLLGRVTGCKWQTTDTSSPCVDGATCTAPLCDSDASTSSKIVLESTNGRTMGMAGGVNQVIDFLDAGASIVQFRIGAMDLQRITTNGSLTFGGEGSGSISVEGILPGHSQNVRSVKIVAKRDKSSVHFESHCAEAYEIDWSRGEVAGVGADCGCNDAEPPMAPLQACQTWCTAGRGCSSAAFRALEVEADDGIKIDSDIMTVDCQGVDCASEGKMVMDGDVNGEPETCTMMPCVDDVTKFAERGECQDANGDPVLGGPNTDWEPGANCDQYNSIRIRQGKQLVGAAEDSEIALKAARGGIIVSPDPTDGALETLSAKKGIKINSNLKTALSGHLRLNANKDADTNNDGSLELASGVTIDTTNGAIDDLTVTADNVTQTDAKFKCGTGTLTINNAGPDGALRTVGLGDYNDKNMVITAAALQRITTEGSLVIGGNATGQGFVKDIGRANSVNVATVKLITSKTAEVEGASTFRTLNVQAADGFSASANIDTHAGPLTINADNDGTGAGHLTISDNAKLRTSSANDSQILTLSCKTIDMSDSGTLLETSHAGEIAIFGTGGATVVIGTGADPTATDLGISAGSLTQMKTTGVLSIGGSQAGSITVKADVDDTATKNAATVRIQATSTSNGAGKVTFANASTFPALVVEAASGIKVDDSIDTTTGSITLDGDTNGAAVGGADSDSDTIVIAAEKMILAATDMTLKATTGKISGPGQLTLKSATGIRLNSNLKNDGDAELMLLANDTSGDGPLTLADDVVVSSDKTIRIAASSLSGNGNFDSAGGDIEIWNPAGGVASLGDGDGMAAGPSGLHIDGDQLQRITTTAGKKLMVGFDSADIFPASIGEVKPQLSSVKVSGVTAAQSAHIAGGVEIVAVALPTCDTDPTCDEDPTYQGGGVISFEQGASTFTTLKVVATSGVDMNASIYTTDDVSGIDIDADTDSDGKGHALAIGNGVELHANSSNGDALDGADAQIKLKGPSAGKGITVNPTTSIMTLQTRKGILLCSNLKTIGAGHLQLDASGDLSTEDSKFVMDCGGGDPCGIDSTHGDQDDITIHAAGLQLGDGGNSVFFQAGNGIVTFAASGRTVDIGTPSPVPAHINLTETNIQKITTKGTLTIGSDTTHSISCSGLTADHTSNVSTVKLVAKVADKDDDGLDSDDDGGVIAFNTSGSTFQTLIMEAADGISLDNVGVNAKGNITLNTDTDKNENSLETTQSGLFLTGANAELRSDVVDCAAIDCVDEDVKDAWRLDNKHHIDITTGFYFCNSCKGLNSHHGNISITRLVDGTVGLGGGAGDLQVSGPDLEKMTTQGTLTLGGTSGSMVVNSISAAHSSNVATVRLLANQDANKSARLVTFDTGASTFRVLEVEAQGGVDVQESVFSLEGHITINADTDTDNNVPAEGRLTVAAGKVIHAKSQESAEGKALPPADIAIHASQYIAAGALKSEHTPSPLMLSAGTISLEPTNGKTAGLTSCIVDPTGPVCPTIGQFEVSMEELQRISTDNTLQVGGAQSGTITAQAILLEPENANVATVKLVAGSKKAQVFFAHENNLSTFKCLEAYASDGISVDGYLRTTVGHLVLDGDNPASDAPAPPTDIRDDEVAGSVTVRNTSTLASKTVVDLRATANGIIVDPLGDPGLELVYGQPPDEVKCSPATFIAEEGINIRSNLKASKPGHLRMNADSDNSGTGMLTVATGATVTPSNVNGDCWTVKAADLEMNGTLSPQNCQTYIIPTQSRDVELGMSPGATPSETALSITGDELKRMSSLGSVTIGSVGAGHQSTAGDIKVDNIPDASIATLKLRATSSGKKVSFVNNRSVFRGLDVLADESILVDVTLVVSGALKLWAKQGITVNRSIWSVGSMVINADSDGGGLGNGMGQFKLAAGRSLDTGGRSLSITASNGVDINEETFFKTHGGDRTFVYTAGLVGKALVKSIKSGESGSASGGTNVVIVGQNMDTQDTTGGTFHKCIFTDGANQMESDYTRPTTPDELVCQTPRWGEQYAAAKVSVTVSKNTQEILQVAPLEFTFYSTYSKISKSEGLASGGTELTITGIGFDMEKTYACRFTMEDVDQKSPKSLSVLATTTGVTSLQCITPDWGPLPTDSFTEKPIQTVFSLFEKTETGDVELELQIDNSNAPANDDPQKQKLTFQFKNMPKAPAYVEHSGDGVILGWDQCCGAQTYKIQSDRLVPSGSGPDAGYTSVGPAGQEEDEVSGSISLYAIKGLFLNTAYQFRVAACEKKCVNGSECDSVCSEYSKPTEVVTTKPSRVDAPKILGSLTSICEHYDDVQCPATARGPSGEEILRTPSPACAVCKLQLVWPRPKYFVADENGDKTYAYEQSGIFKLYTDYDGYTTSASKDDVQIDYNDSKMYNKDTKMITYTVDKLFPHASYTFRVAVVGVSGEGAISLPSLVARPSDVNVARAPARVEEIEASSTCTTKITVEWTPAQTEADLLPEMHCKIDRYYIAMRTRLYSDTMEPLPDQDEQGSQLQPLWSYDDPEYYDVEAVVLKKRYVSPGKAYTATGNVDKMVITFPPVLKTLPNQNGQNIVLDKPDEEKTLEKYFIQKKYEFKVRARNCNHAQNVYDMCDCHPVDTCCSPWSPPSMPIQTNKRTACIYADPHFSGFEGDKYDVHGEAGHIYNILSDQDLQYNALFIPYIGSSARLRNRLDGTVIGAAGIRIGQHQLYFDKSGRAALDGSRLSNGQHKFKLLNGSQGSVDLQGSRLTVRTGDYTIRLAIKEDGSTRTGLYLNHRVTIHDQRVARILSEGIGPHGLLGQTADMDSKPRYGKLGSKAQGQGVIEGNYKQYEIQGKDIFGIDFEYNRFGVAEIKQSIKKNLGKHVKKHGVLQGYTW